MGWDVFGDSAMNFWEVLDDAVKIGLGAALGLVGARFAEVREWRKKRKSHRIKTLEEIAKNFEVAYQAVMDMVVDVRTARRKGQPLPSPREGGGTARSHLYSVESQLQLLGYPKCVEGLKKYSEASQEFIDAAISEDAGAEERYKITGGKFLASRAEFYCVLRTAYQESEGK